MHQKDFLKNVFPFSIALYRTLKEKKTKTSTFKNGWWKCLKTF